MSATPPPEPDVPQPGLRFLEWTVYIMGGLLVLMFVGLIGGIVWKVAHRSPPPPVETQTLDLSLAEGTPIRSTEIDGDRLVIATDREIIVIDVKRNAVLSRIVLHAK